jgi:hypothetical protein
MLILGFGWICFWQLEMYPIIRGAISANYDKIPKQQSYQIEDVQKAIRDVAFDIDHHIPAFFIGALFMIAGGITLDVAGRRRRTQPNNALQPTAAAQSLLTKR